LAYESGFLTEAETVLHTAAHLGMAVTQAQAKTIFASSHRAAVEKYIARMPNQPGTLLAETFDDLAAHRPGGTIIMPDTAASPGIGARRSPPSK
jgi:predicted methyltransferase